MHHIAALSNRVVMTTIPTYQTGIMTVWPAAPPQQIKNVATDFAVALYGVVPASSNASLGIVTNHFTMNNNNFGWMIWITSVGSSSINVRVSTNSNNNFVSYLQVCYLVNWNPNIYVNYAAFVLGNLIYIQILLQVQLLIFHSLHRIVVQIMWQIVDLLLLLIFPIFLLIMGMLLVFIYVDFMLVVWPDQTTKPSELWLKPKQLIPIILRC
jgi:hypothetical protein